MFDKTYLKAVLKKKKRWKLLEKVGAGNFTHQLCNQGTVTSWPVCLLRDLVLGRVAGQALPWDGSQGSVSFLWC